MSNGGGEGGGTGSVRLSEVVAECVSRWFQETLKEAQNGNTSMQVLVSQMFYKGYGVPKDIVEGEYWMTKASLNRPWVLAVRDKRPGYGPSDSDSDEPKEDS